MKFLARPTCLAFLGVLLTTGAAANADGVLRCGLAAPGRYIVVLADDHRFPPLAMGPEEVLEQAQGLRVQYGGHIRHVYHSALRGYAVADLSEPEARLLANDSRVAWVEEDCILRPSAIQINPVWELDRVDERYLPPDYEYVYNRTGLGVHAYILDFLIRSTHEEFEGRVQSRVDCTGVDPPASGSCPPVPEGEYIPLSHGTSVASKIGGAELGVAKKVTLHSVKVCDDLDGSPGGGTDCFASDVIAGVNYVKAHRNNPAIANISLNYPSYHPDFFTAAFALRAAIESAIADGVSFTISAGNDDYYACSSPPANVPDALVVAATKSNDVRWEQSNFGSCVDLFAPGEAVTVALRTSDTATGVVSGTSYAAPLVAGVAALYLQRAPGATPAQVTNFILSWATSGVVGDPEGTPNLLLYSRYGGLKED